MPEAMNLPPPLALSPASASLLAEMPAGASTPGEPGAFAKILQHAQGHAGSKRGLSPAAGDDSADTQSAGDAKIQPGAEPELREPIGADAEEPTDQASAASGIAARPDPDVDADGPRSLPTRVQGPVDPALPTAPEVTVVDTATGPAPTPTPSLESTPAGLESTATSPGAVARASTAAAATPAPTSTPVPASQPAQPAQPMTPPVARRPTESGDRATPRTRAAAPAPAAVAPARPPTEPADPETLGAAQTSATPKASAPRRVDAHDDAHDRPADAGVAAALPVLPAGPPLPGPAVQAGADTAPAPRDTVASADRKVAPDSENRTPAPAPAAEDRMATTDRAPGPALVAHAVGKAGAKLDDTAMPASPSHPAIAAAQAMPSASVAPPALVGGEPWRLAAPLHSAGFAPELGTQLRLMVKEGQHEARLHLNPAEMGPIQVRIQLDGPLARVDMLAEHAATRQVLEQAMPALASALRDSGLTLTGGGVFQQPRDPRQPQRSGNPWPGRSGRDAGDAATGAISGSGDPLRGVGRARGVLDLYA